MLKINCLKRICKVCEYSTQRKYDNYKRLSCTNGELHRVSVKRITWS